MLPYTDLRRKKAVNMITNRRRVVAIQVFDGILKS